MQYISESCARFFGHKMTVLRQVQILLALAFCMYSICNVDSHANDYTGKGCIRFSYTTCCATWEGQHWFPNVCSNV